MMNGYNWSCPMCGYGSATGIGWLDALLFWLFALAILAGLVLFVVWLVRRSTHGQQPTGGTQDSARMLADDSAARIARERFARGELTKEQLDEILQHLNR